MNGAMQWIRDHYPVPAKRGMRVECDGQPGRIMSAANGHLVLWMYNTKPSHRVRAHPCWRMVYFDDEGNILVDTWEVSR